MTQHILMGGRLHIYKRENSRFWQCSTFMAGRNRRMSTKEESLGQAKDFAEDWYLELRGKAQRGEIKHEKTFTQAAEQFEREYQIITEGQRNAQYVEGHDTPAAAAPAPLLRQHGAFRDHARPIVQEYRIHRREKAIEERGKAAGPQHHAPGDRRSAADPEDGHAPRLARRLPDLSEPYRASGKISHRAWFSPEEYKKLYEATRERAQNPKSNRYKWESEQLHDYVLFMANTGLRPDEAARLEYRDVKIVEDEATGETILEIEVRGKRGVGYCKSMRGAVTPFQRLKKRNKPQPTDLLFPEDPPRACSTPSSTRKA